MVKIISDSSTLYSQEEAKNLGLHLCNLSVIVDGKSYKEFEELSSEELIEKINAGSIPSTSQPAVGEKMDLYEELGKDHEVIDISMAAGLSGTYDSALMAREGCDYKDNITVFNTRTLCGPHREMVDKALQMASAGKTRAEIVTMLEKSSSTESSFLIPFDFDFLKRGGRVSKAAAGLGGLLKLVVCMGKSEDGREIVKHSVNRTLKKAVQSMIEALEEKGVDSTYSFYLAHADNLETSEAIHKLLEKHYGPIHMTYYPLSPAFITQGGPKCIALQVIKVSE